MAITEITEPSTSNPQTADWALFINNLILKTKHLNAVSITNGFNNDEPVIELGSSFEINDIFYYCNSNELITGWDSISDGVVYIYTNGTSFFYSSTAPVFNEGSWYNGSDRAIYKLEKDGATGWKYKIKMPFYEENISQTFMDITIQRDMSVANEMYAANLNVTSANITNYLESNGGADTITTMAPSGGISVTGTATINGTTNISGQLQASPTWTNNVWSDSGTVQDFWPTANVPPQFCVFTFISSHNSAPKFKLQIWTGSSWVGNLCTDHGKCGSIQLWGTSYSDPSGETGSMFRMVSSDPSYEMGLRIYGS